MDNVSSFYVFHRYWTAFAGRGLRSLLKVSKLCHPGYRLWRAPNRLRDPREFDKCQGESLPLSEPNNLPKYQPSSFTLLWSKCPRLLV